MTTMKIKMFNVNVFYTHNVIAVCLTEFKIRFQLSHKLNGAPCLEMVRSRTSLLI